MRRRPGHGAVVLLSVLVLAAVAALVRAGITHDFDRDALRAVQSVANGAFDLIANLHTPACTSATTGRPT